MNRWKIGHLKKRATHAYHKIGGADVVKRHDVATSFAKHHKLAYFHTVSANTDTAPVIRGITASPQHIDSNFCIGAHAGYDIALIERSATVEFTGFETTSHHWYVLEIDLKRARDLPFMFVGTKQLPKAFYAKVLVSRRDIRYLQLDSRGLHESLFHGTYALIASPTSLPQLHSLFTDDVQHSMSVHTYPFSVEIEGDSLIVFTEAEKASEQLMDKLLHYGLWMAEAIDEQLG